MWSKRVYCSPILGTLLLKGQPVQHVVVHREVVVKGFQSLRFRDAVTTSDLGQFALPEVAQKSIRWPTPFKHAPLVLQRLEVEVEGFLYCIWAFAKTDFDVGSETGQSEIRLSCELSLKGEKAKYREVEWVIDGAIA